MEQGRTCGSVKKPGGGRTIDGLASGRSCYTDHILAYVPWSARFLDAGADLLSAHGARSRTSQRQYMGTKKASAAPCCVSAEHVAMRVRQCCSCSSGLDRPGVLGVVRPPSTRTCTECCARLAACAPGRVRSGRSDGIPRPAHSRPKFSRVQQLYSRSCPFYRAHFIHIFSTFINKI